MPVDGQTVTITREAGSLTGVTLAYPATLTRNLQVTIAALLDGVPLASERFGLGTTPAAQAGATLTVVGVPAGGLEICLPLSDALVSEAGSRPLTLVRYEGTGWQGAAGCGTAGDVGLRGQGIHRVVCGGLCTAAAGAGIRFDGCGG